MNSRRDWEIVQSEGWYRIPLRRAPRQIAADHLAFYHTAAFPEERWSIRYYAPVQAVHIVRRDALLPAEVDHARAKALYYRFDLAPLQTLDEPLTSRRLRRITFIHTTLKRLLEVDDVADLWLNAPLRERLWVEFNRQGVHAEQGAILGADPLGQTFDFVIPCYRGAVVVDCQPGGPTAEIDAWREGSPGYPRSERERALHEAGASWLRFEDAGWEVNLDFYFEQVWRAIEERGGQL
jgi:hypothetical protein